MSKPRLIAYVSNDIRAKVAAAARKPGVSQSEIIEAALDAFFSHEIDDQRDGAMMRRIDRMSRQMARLERNDAIFAEMMTRFVRIYLTFAPMIPEASKQAAKLKGDERFSRYIDAVKGQLERRRSVFEDAFEDFVPSSEDFFETKDLADLNGGGHA